MKRLAAFVVGVGLAGVALAAQVGPNSTIYRSPVDLVPVFATVTDATNRVVSGLAREDFTVRDNGVVRDLTVFDSAPRSMRLVLMLDVSASMRPNLILLREACEEVFKRLRPGDGVRIGTFGREITIAPAFSGDVDDLRRALPADINMRALTPLWRAVDAGMSVLEDADSRPVLMVFSDGRDSGPSPGEREITRAQVLARAAREGIMVYAVGLHSFGGNALPAGAVTITRTGDARPDPGLSALATGTGGRYFEVDVDPKRDLGAAFGAAMDELHGQYLLGFSSANDGAVHQIDVAVTRPGFNVRARRTYQAPLPEQRN